jgi:hypothetical protein
MTQTAVIERKAKPRRRSSSNRLSPAERDDLRSRFKRESELRKALAQDTLSATERGRLEFELMEISPYVAEVLRLNFREDDPGNADLTEPEKLDRRKEDARRLVDAVRLADTLAERIEIYRAYGKRLLCLACSWLGEEMPELNGDWEWLVYCSADLGKRG